MARRRWRCGPRASYCGRAGSRPSTSDTSGTASWSGRSRNTSAGIRRSRTRPRCRTSPSSARWLGMSKEQVLLLLGPPAGTATDPAALETLGRAYWPAIKAGNATEAWVYPLGWRLFFDGVRVVDITQYLETR